MIGSDLRAYENLNQKIESENLEQKLLANKTFLTVDPLEQDHCDLFCLH